VKKWLAFYGTRRLIAQFKRVGPKPEPDKISPQNSAVFLSYILIVFIHLCLVSPSYHFLFRFIGQRSVLCVLPHPHTLSSCFDCLNIIVEEYKLCHSVLIIFVICLHNSLFWVCVATLFGTHVPSSGHCICLIKLLLASLFYTYNYIESYCNCTK
jgi:hypothetical protein